MCKNGNTYLKLSWKDGGLLLEIQFKTYIVRNAIKTSISQFHLKLMKQNIQTFLFQECGIKLDIVGPNTTLKLKSKATNREK